jgi:carbamate kinase
LDKLTVTEAKKHLADGHFLAGSMGPKVEAVIDFLEARPNAKALITQPSSIAEALDDKSGTWLVGG